jgi:hypothetical protein
MRSDNTSGFCGVYYSRRMKKWGAQIHVEKSAKHLGFFAKIEDAAAARKAAERDYGLHSNNGREE